MGLKIKRREK